VAHNQTSRGRRSTNESEALRSRLAEFEHALSTLRAEVARLRRTETELRDKTALLESIFRAAPVGVGLVRDRVLLEVNARVCEMSGYDAGELIGKDARLLYPSQTDYEYVATEKSRQIRDCGTGTIETRWQRKDGSVIDVLLSSSPLDLGDLSAGVTFSALDITQQKAVIRALRESEERFSKAFRHSPALMAITSLPEGLIHEVNDTFLDTLGYERHQVVGQTTVQLGLWTDSRQRDALVRAVQRSGRAGPIELCFKTSSGGKMHGLLSADVIRLGNQPYLLSSLLDITERRRHEAAQQRLELQLRQTAKLESLGLLASGVAHDFNNLLVGIVANAGLALSQLPGSGSVTDYVRDIETAASRAAELVRQLLAYVGRGRSAVERVDLAPLAAEMGHLLTASIPKSTRLDFDFAPRAPATEADPAQLRQVIMNLITNASDAIGDGGGVITVSTELVDCDEACLRDAYFDAHLSSGQYVCLAVSDTGMGMDAETQAKIFDPFFSTKRSGRGLGLAAVLGIVRSHHGTVKVQSRPGQGTRFEVLLPAATAPPPVAEHAPEPTRSWQAQGGVLLIDDEAVVRKVGKRLFTHLGFDVVVACNGREGVRLFEQDPERFVLVVCDLSMPEMSGEETLHQLRRVRPAVRVLMTSGYDSEALAERMAALGVAGFLQKPYQLATVIGIVRQALE
jgi:two-component system cell cycle sensor histidine kinase/response regulator CckA